MGKKPANVADGLMPSEMSREQLLGYIKRLLDEIDREKDERNWYMIEREKLYQMWNVLIENISLEKEKLLEMDIHTKATEAEKDEKDRETDGQIRYLKREQNSKLGQIRLYHLLKMRQAQDDAWAMQMLLSETYHTKRREVRRAQVSFFETIRGLYWKHARDVSDMRNEFSKELRRLETSFDKILFESNDKDEEVQEKEFNRLALHKEEKIKSLIEFHESQFLEIKTFYSDLNINNVAIVNSLKITLKKAQLRELNLTKMKDGIVQRYENMEGPMNHYLEEMDEWNKEKLANPLIEDLSKEIRNKNFELRKLKDYNRKMDSTNEALLQRLILGEKERAHFKQKYDEAVAEIQKRCSMKMFTLKLKKKALIKERHLYEALAENMEKDPNDKQDYFGQLIAQRDQQLEQLRTQIADFAAKHKTTVDIYMAALDKNEINKTDIGFPIRGTGAKAALMEEDAYSEYMSHKDTISIGTKSRGTIASSRRVSVGKSEHPSSGSGETRSVVSFHSPHGSYIKSGKGDSISVSSRSKI